MIATLLYITGFVFGVYLHNIGYGIYTIEYWTICLFTLMINLLTCAKLDE